MSACDSDRCRLRWREMQLFWRQLPLERSLECCSIQAMKRLCLLIVGLVIVQGAHAALTLANFNIDPSTGAISGTITGTVSELGTSTNNWLFLGQQGVDWVTAGTYAAENPTTSPISVGSSSTVGLGGTYGIGSDDTVPWLTPPADFFYITLENTATIGDVIDFTFQGSIGSGLYPNVNTSLLTNPVVRVGVGSVDPAVVPEPSTYAAILGVLCLGFIFIRRRQRRQ